MDSGGGVLWRVDPERGRFAEMVDEESDRNRPVCIFAAANIWASSAEIRISDTGRGRRERDIGRPGGDGVGCMRLGTPKRRRRFAFSRGPASFLKIDLRRWPCLEYGSGTKLDSVGVGGLSDRGWPALALRRPGNKGRVSGAPQGSWLTG